MRVRFVRLEAIRPTYFWRSMHATVVIAATSCRRMGASGATAGETAIPLPEAFDCNTLAGCRRKHGFREGLAGACQHPEHHDLCTVDDGNAGCPDAHHLCESSGGVTRPLPL